MQCLLLIADPVVDTAEWPPSVPSRSTGQHMLLGSHSEVGGVQHQAPPPGHAHLQPSFAGTEQSSYTTSMHNADKAITASSLADQVQLPVSVGQSDTTAQEFNTKAGADVQPPAVCQLSSTILTQDLSESSSPSSSLSMGELHHPSSPQSFKKASVTEPQGLNCPQQAIQPTPSTGKSNTGSSCSPTPSSASTTSCKGSTALSDNLQDRGIVPTVGGLDEPVAVVVEQKAEDKSLLSDEDNQSEEKQEGEISRLEVASLSNSSLVDELCEEDSVLPSVTSPPHQHGDDRAQPNLTILDILSPQESDVQDQKPSPLPENVELELEPYGATQEQVTADQQSNINRAGHEQRDLLLTKEKESLDDDNSDDDSFWDVEPGAVAVSPSLPLLDSETPADREAEQSKLLSEDKPPQDETGHIPETNLLHGILNQGSDRQSGSQTDSSPTGGENGFPGNGHPGGGNGLPMSESAEYKQMISSFSRGAGGVGGEGDEGGESAQSSLLSENSAVRHIEEVVVGGRTDASGRNREVPAENARWVYMLSRSIGGLLC